ncbi:MAG: 3'(2'),5'-bisphosphate nucleotidase CysQ [Candidatus Latescibacterota bacterium]|nr:3'(2'),5'-bisphosphate nucleotidase CysQ [Candidatus Latescibacterota bacterium]
MLQPDLELAMQAAREAGIQTLEYFNGQYEIEDKGKGDPLTTADLAANAVLSERLRSARSAYGWLSEETVDDKTRLSCQKTWIVDPIDGTREFIEGLPEYVVCVALCDNSVPTIGVIYNPARDALYAAVHQGGAFLNGKRIFCSETSSLTVATSIVSRSEDKRGEINPFRPHIGPVTPVGSVAYKLALVAAGESDINFSVQPKNEWDVCAGDLLIREAGGHMLDLQGNVRHYNQADPLIRGGLVAGNTELTRQFLRLIDEVRE